DTPSLVPTRRGYVAAIMAKRRIGDYSRVSERRSNWVTRLCIPDSCRHVAVGNDYSTTVRAEGHGFNASLHDETSAVLHDRSCRKPRPGVPNADRSVPSCCGYAAAIGVEDN